MTTFSVFIDARPHNFTLHGYIALFETIKAGGRKGLEAPCVVLMAFLVEAYVNSLGARKIVAWDAIERIPWRNKIELLHAHANQKADWSREPLAFATELFKVRDKLAHGKPERIHNRDLKVPDGHTYSSATVPVLADRSEPKWYKRIDRAWILASRPKLEALLAYLAVMHGLDAMDFQSVGDIRIEPAK